MLKRYSSRRGDIFTDFLARSLPEAKSYDRIAGYFSSSILEIAGEALEKMTGQVRVVCNSDLDVRDAKTAQLAASALRQEWCRFEPEKLPQGGERFQRLYDFLQSGKLVVRVLPKEKFGLVHGKAGVITFADDSKTSFLGSVNESYQGWKINYELVWEDNDIQSVQWVQDEFDALWNNPYAVNLSDYIINDIKRIAHRSQISSVEDWREKEKSEPAAVVVESPIFRQGFGLWEHQKYFVSRAFREHKTAGGARLVLADQVGLGKTAQLALAAELMALYGKKPVLVVVPKTLMEQWQDELWNMLGIPSAIWKKVWIDEGGIEYPLPVNACPRRIGIVSQGIIVNGSEACREIQEKLLAQEYECVIVDEAHRIRRSNTGEKKADKKPECNNLYKFMLQISVKTHSMLLATATPVQLHPVEAFDLLNVLSYGKDSVLGGKYSLWRNYNLVPMSLRLITNEERLDDESSIWEWMKNPFPPAVEDEQSYGFIRSEFDMKDDMFICRHTLSDFVGPARTRLEDAIEEFFLQHNPYIRHIVRRERRMLETTVNPETGLPYLKPIHVELLGEDDSGALTLQTYLQDAYKKAEEFCKLLQKRTPAAGFFKTLLLKRIGSSMRAGLMTGRHMLENWDLASEYDEEDDDEFQLTSIDSEVKSLTAEETQVLKDFVRYLELGMENAEKEQTPTDPKYAKIKHILENGVRLSTGKRTKPWHELGCIIFSQFYDSAEWVAQNLSRAFQNEEVGLYAGGNKSGLFINGQRQMVSKVEIKEKVKTRKIKVLVGTDAASEGLNLQTLGTLINLDLPWNPTRLEQRKGRIQRIGQQYDTVYLYNLRYKGSVEDRVHELLSERFKSIFQLFGQLPDVLDDVWVDIAVGNQEEAMKKIKAVPIKNPFAVRYHDNVAAVDWESCDRVLRQEDVTKALLRGW